MPVRKTADPGAEGYDVNEWLRAHEWHIVIGVVAFHLGAMGEPLWT